MTRDSGQLGEVVGIPRRLEERINGVFVASMGRALSVNDSYGSPAMREIILDETNALRRYVLNLAQELLNDGEHPS